MSQQTRTATRDQLFPRKAKGTAREGKPPRQSGQEFRPLPIKWQGIPWALSMMVSISWRLLLAISGISMTLLRETIPMRELVLRATQLLLAGTRLQLWARPMQKNSFLI